MEKVSDEDEEPDYPIPGDEDYAIQVSSEEEIEHAVRENKMQNRAVDNWLEAVAGVHDVEVKKEQAGTPSNVADKKGKNVVIYISDEEE
jgi:hypothetical protein